MRFSEFDLEQRDTLRIKSPGRCIYCGASDAKLTDEHVVPYALAANTLVLEKSCCEACQRTIQPYEQEVLRTQLGIFRAQVDAPTRSKKDRITAVRLHFVEVDSAGRVMRDLGFRSVPIEQSPLMFNLWSSPPPRLLRGEGSIDERGRPWSHVDRDVAVQLCRQVATEVGANHVAVKTGEVNRLHYLRALAKTAHAFAAAMIGMDAFQPLLKDLILTRSDDVANFVGDDPRVGPADVHPAHTLQMFLGEAVDGPAKGLLVARIQLYPQLNSPAHMIVVGKALEDIGSRFGGPEQQE